MHLHLPRRRPDAETPLTDMSGVSAGVCAAPVNTEAWASSRQEVNRAEGKMQSDTVCHLHKIRVGGRENVRGAEEGSERRSGGSIKQTD